MYTASETYFPNNYFSITDFMETLQIKYTIIYIIISVTTVWFRWKLPLSSDVDYKTPNKSQHLCLHFRVHMDDSNATLFIITSALAISCRCEIASIYCNWSRDYQHSIMQHVSKFPLQWPSDSDVKLPVWEPYDPVHGTVHRQMIWKTQ